MNTSNYSIVDFFSYVYITADECAWAYWSLFGMSDIISFLILLADKSNKNEHHKEVSKVKCYTSMTFKREFIVLQKECIPRMACYCLLNSKDKSFSRLRYTWWCYKTALNRKQSACFHSGLVANCQQNRSDDSVWSIQRYFAIPMSHDVLIPW